MHDKLQCTIVAETQQLGYSLAEQCYCIYCWNSNTHTHTQTPCDCAWHKSPTKKWKKKQFHKKSANKVNLSQQQVCTVHISHTHTHISHMYTSVRFKCRSYLCMPACMCVSSCLCVFDTCSLLFYSLSRLFACVALFGCCPLLHLSHHHRRTDLALFA